MRQARESWADWCARPTLHARFSPLPSSSASSAPPPQVCLSSASAPLDSFLRSLSAAAAAGVPRVAPASAAVATADACELEGACISSADNQAE